VTTVFNKYEGAGNDFVIIDNLRGDFIAETGTIASLCNRRFGIGADGLILIEKEPLVPYRMRYFNSDGKEGSMCGNGGRCAAHFAVRHGIALPVHQFIASDGMHNADVGSDTVTISMSDVSGITHETGNYFLNTGSPHLVIFTADAESANVAGRGREIRYSPRFAPHGTNVNFVKTEENNTIFVRTYERGVEDETLSCGTGVTASAIASVFAGHFVTPPVAIRTRGGNLLVDFRMEGNMVTGVKLNGPATFVFEGEINI